MNKSPYPLYILKFLSEYTSKHNPLSHTEIAKRIKEKYEIETDIKTLRKTVVRHVEAMSNLLEKDYLGFTVEIPDNNHIFLDKNAAFTDGEMLLLLDCLFFSKCISFNQSKYLVNKLVQQMGKNFQDDIEEKEKDNNSKLLPGLHGDNDELIKTYETITKAIKDNKRINFKFAVYGPGGKEKIIKEYCDVSPYELVMVNSRFYLISANNEGEPRHFRVDYMYNVVPGKWENSISDGKLRLKSKNRLPIRQIKGLNEYLNRFGIDLERYLSERPYMYGGESIKVKFAIEKDFVNQAYDWFGPKTSDVEYEKNPQMRMVTVYVVEEAMINWLLQYGRYVEVLEPPRLREKVRDAVIGMCKKYGIEVKEETKTGKLDEQKGND